MKLGHWPLLSSFSLLAHSTPKRQLDLFLLAILVERPVPSLTSSGSVILTKSIPSQLTRQNSKHKDVYNSISRVR